MKKSNENKPAFLNLTPAEEKAILLSFERYVSAYGQEMKKGVEKRPKPTIVPSKQSTLRWAF